MRRALAMVAVGVVMASTGQAYGSTIAITGPVVADGHRWAAWKPNASTAVVYDDRSGRRRSVTVPDCPLSGVTGRTLLVQCPGVQYPSTLDPVLVDIGTGTLTNVGGADLRPIGIDMVSFTGLGTRGLLVHVDGYHYRGDYALDWRSRRTRGLNDPDRVVDLDRARLTRPLCAGVERTPNPDFGDVYEGPPPFLPMSYSGRRALEYVPARSSAYTPPGRLRLWRCGVERPRVIRRCGCADVNLAGGLATWAETRAHALDLRSGTRRSWAFPSGGYGRVAQAGRTLLLWTQQSSTTDPPEALRLVRWPRRNGSLTDTAHAQPRLVCATPARCKMSATKNPGVHRVSGSQ